MAALMAHVEYLIWAGDAARRANHRWSQERGTAIPLFSAKDLHFHLYETGVDEGWITRPKNGKRKHPCSWYVAQAYSYDADTVKAAARAYWRLKVEEGSAL